MNPAKFECSINMEFVKHELLSRSGVEWPREITLGPLVGARGPPWTTLPVHGEPLPRWPRWSRVHAGWSPWQASGSSTSSRSTAAASSCSNCLPFTSRLTLGRRWKGSRLSTSSSKYSRSAEIMKLKPRISLPTKARRTPSYCSGPWSHETNA